MLPREIVAQPEEKIPQQRLLGLREAAGGLPARVRRRRKHPGKARCRLGRDRHDLGAAVLGVGFARDEAGGLEPVEETTKVMGSTFIFSASADCLRPGWKST